MNCSRSVVASVHAGLSCFFFGFALAAGTAGAQGHQSQARQQTVVVTGTRQAYRGDFDPLKTPQAELSMDARTLADSGAVDLDQALDLSASVARQNDFGGLWNAFAVRGFVGDENLPGNYLVNGFNAGRGFGGPRDLSGIDSVEVLKGPRAALFGRGEPGGTINLVTKRPDFQTEGTLTATAGSWDLYRADGDWRTAVGENLAVRLVGFYENANSFRETVSTVRYGASPSVAFRLDSATRIEYELEYSHQEIPFDRGVLALGGRLGRIPVGRFLGEPGDGPMKTDVLGHQLELQRELNRNWSVLVGAGFRDTSLEGFSTEAELSQSRQLLTTTRTTSLNDGETLTRQRRYRKYDANHLVVRGEIAGQFDTAGVRHRVILGADYDRFENRQTFLRVRAAGISPESTLQGLQAINIFDPVYGRFPLPDLGTGTPFVQTFRSTGVFFQDQISLTDRLEIRFGARYDDFTQEETGRSDNRISPQFGIVYEMTDSISLYAAYGQNFRQLSGMDADGNGFDPNTSTSIEAGVKWVLGALTGTAAVFSLGQDNILVVDDPGLFTLAAAGKAQSQGIELDLNGEIVDGLSLWASYAYVDAKTGNDFFDANFGRNVPQGTRLLNIPLHQLSLLVVQSTRLAGKPLDVGGGLNYVSERNGYFGVDFDLPGYAIVNAFATWDLTDAIALRAEVGNLFDQTWYINSFSDLWVRPGAPRHFKLSIAVHL